MLPQNDLENYIENLARNKIKLIRRSSKKNGAKIYYKCSRQSKAQPKILLQIYRKRAPNFGSLNQCRSCPAFLNVTIRDQKAVVYGNINFHSHQTAKTNHISAECRKYIVKCLRDNVKERSIISTARQKFKGCWIGPKLIHNLRQKFITNPKILNQNDMISTQMIAEKNPAIIIDSLNINETRIMYCSVSMQSRVANRRIFFPMP